MKRELGEIWKEGRFWKVQFPKGILTYKTKKWAKKAAEVVIPLREKKEAEDDGC